MIWVARRFSRAICMVKKPVVKPENSAAIDVPTTPMPTVTSMIENAAIFLRRAVAVGRTLCFEKRC